MKRIIASTTITDIALIGSSIGFAGAFDRPVKWRQALKQIYSFSFGIPGDTCRATPEISSTYPRVAEKGKALVAAATNLTSAAGIGLDAPKANMDAVGRACKACQGNFRVPKNKTGKKQDR